MDQNRYVLIFNQLIDQLHNDLSIDKEKLSMVLHNPSEEACIESLMDELSVSTQAKAIELWYLDSARNQYLRFDGTGSYSKAVVTTKSNLPVTDFEIFLSSSKPQAFHTIQKQRSLDNFLRHQDEIFDTLISIPLPTEKFTSGVILLFAPVKQHHPTLLSSSQTDLVRLIASLLFANRIDDPNPNYVQKNMNINALLSLELLSDPYTHCHEYKVSKLAVQISRYLDLHEQRIHNIALAAMVHDIGKLLIPRAILNKPGKLTDEEYALVKTHSIIGGEILNHIGFSNVITDIVTQHHERLDGTGYPLGLKADEISLESQILSVADVIVAISDRRCYQKMRSIEESLMEIKKLRGIQFSDDLIVTMERMYEEKLLNTFTC